MSPLLRAVVEEAAQMRAGERPPAGSLLAAENAWRFHYGDQMPWRVGPLLAEPLPELPPLGLWETLRELWQAYLQTLRDRNFRARMAIRFDRDRLIGEWQD